MVGLRKFVVLVIAIVAVTAVACGGDTVELQGTVGETTSATVTAADGGTVALPSGAAQIVIPAGALSADTDITLNTLDVAGMVDEDRLGSYVFDFGPDGTTFAEKVEISLKSGGVPSNMEVNLAWLDGDKWTKVPGSKLDGDMIVGEVDHFTKFVVYFTEKEVVIVTDDPICKDLEFVPCGGDPVGVWEIETFCMETRVDANESPWAEQFPECGNGNSYYSADIDWLGQMDVRADGTSTTDFDVAYTIEVVLKDACLSAMGQGMVGASTMCDQIALQYTQESVDATVSYSGGKCTISAPQETQDQEPSEGTWVVVGDEIRSSADATSGSKFCVDGTRMVIQTLDEEDTDDDGVDDTTYTDYIVLKRK